MKTIIGLIVLLIIVSLAIVYEPSEKSDERIEPIELSFGYETQMVETYPFGEAGPIVIDCEGVYLID